MPDSVPAAGQGETHAESRMFRLLSLLCNILPALSTVGLLNVASQGSLLQGVCALNRK